MVGLVVHLLLSFAVLPSYTQATHYIVIINNRYILYTNDRKIGILDMMKTSIQVALLKSTETATAPVTAATTTAYW